MLTIAISIFPIFALIAIGYIISRYSTNTLSFWPGAQKISYYVFFPSLLVHALATTPLDHDVHAVVSILIATTLVLAAILLILQHYFPANNETFTSCFQGVTRYNSYIFMGVSVALLGHKSLPLVAVIMTYMIIITNILNVSVISMYIGSPGIQIADVVLNIIKNPIIIACVLGVILEVGPVKLPAPIMSVLQYLANAALPLSLMCVGAGLRCNTLLAKGTLLILFTNSMRLIIFPLLVIVGLKLFAVSASMAATVAIIYATVPTAGNAYILAKQMGGDAETMASIISSMMIMSLVTMPIMLSFASWLLAK